VGVPGELHIGGAGLARGYLERPELTAERFVVDPFSDEAGSRLFKTGDLVRYGLDGVLEYLGRVDQQVKVRGYRIEAGEVETALESHDGVREAVVVADGSERLVAYYVKGAEASVGAAELREQLGRTLPAYMVPSVYVELEELPLTASGKVDRRALPEPGGAAQVEVAYVAPRTGIEEVLAEIWAEVLGVNPVGVHNDFFALGGHSLMAAQVLSRVRAALDVDVGLAELFASPTVARLADCVQARGGKGAGALPRIERVSREQPLPLSFAQERLWFLDQLEPGNPAYNIFGALRLLGELDIAALERAFQELVRRHEALRSSFAVSGDRVVQIIDAEPEFRIDVEDLRQLPPQERKREVKLRCSDEALRPFALDRGPLLRVGLLRLAEAERVLLVCVHHIVSDAWSLGVLVREVGLLYGAYARGETSPLPELTVQYADFASWQRSWLQGERLERTLSYWHERLAGASALELPTDRPRPAAQTYRGAQETAVLPGALVGELKALGRAEGATLFMVLVAALSVLLQRYSGQDDIVVGSPIANRNHSELESVVGFFVNTLVLRTDLVGDPTVRELVAQVRRTALEAYAHQDLPLERLLAELGLARDLSRNPLFQVFVALQNVPFEPAALEGVTLQAVPFAAEATQFDLELYFAEAGDGLLVTCRYNRDLFDAGTIRRMLGHYERVLAAMVGAPQARVSAVSLLGADEHAQLESWNTTQAAYPQTCLHALFEWQVERTPEAVAVAYADEQLTYAELNARANGLAHHLVGLGVGPGVLVGVCVERSLEMLVALLGVLKAGGAYVPLDPSYPAERLQYMIEDAATSVLLTQRGLTDRVTVGDTQAVYLDEMAWSEGDGAPGRNPAVAVGPDELAYVIYTSGSTGRPKGVAVAHRSLVNFLWSMKAEPGVSEHDVLLAVTTLSFDIAGLELYLPLLVGARVVIATSAEVRDGRALMSRLHRSGATVMQATPVTWRMLLQAGWDGGAELKILCGGEALTQDLARELLPKGASLWNLYGPTEATIWSTLERVHVGEGRVTVGRPIANTRAYVLDDALEPVPVGVLGELYLGGDGVARGYWRRPELTSERFVPEPFVDDDAARMYRTGDLARYRGDGRLEILGRADFQVKVRGFRIELGEVELALAQHPSVRQAVVVACADVTDTQQLVAYVIPEAGSDLSWGELREHVKARLPEYMVPVNVVWLDAFPLTLNGKVDRKALPDPSRTRDRGSDELAAPRGTLEILMARIWEDLLDVDEVSAYDTFFDLGGHSLLTLKVVDRLERETGVRIKPGDLVTQTLRQLISAIEAQIEPRAAPSGDQPKQGLFEAFKTAFSKNV
jgi:amino acid adenylation domain-containing protein